MVPDVCFLIAVPRNSRDCQPRVRREVNFHQDSSLGNLGGICGIWSWTSRQRSRFIPESDLLCFLAVWSRVPRKEAGTTARSQPATNRELRSRVLFSLCQIFAFGFVCKDQRSSSSWPIWGIPKYKCSSSQTDTSRQFACHDLERKSQQTEARERNLFRFWKSGRKRRQQ